MLEKVIGLVLTLLAAQINSSLSLQPMLNEADWPTKGRSKLLAEVDKFEEKFKLSETSKIQILPTVSVTSQPTVTLTLSEYPQTRRTLFGQVLENRQRSLLSFAKTEETSSFGYQKRKHEGLAHKIRHSKRKLHHREINEELPNAFWNWRLKQDVEFNDEESVLQNSPGKNKIGAIYRVLIEGNMDSQRKGANATDEELINKIEESNKEELGHTVNNKLIEQKEEEVKEREGNKNGSLDFNQLWKSSNDWNKESQTEGGTKLFMSPSISLSQVGNSTRASVIADQRMARMEGIILLALLAAFILSATPFVVAVCCLYCRRRRSALRNGELLHLHPENEEISCGTLLCEACCLPDNSYQRHCAEWAAKHVQKPSLEGGEEQEVGKKPSLHTLLSNLPPQRRRCKEIKKPLLEANILWRSQSLESLKE